ncbi:transcriptional regulator [Halomarina litorea]|uniref:transcriptional regulator n=1 Tax=Halomarina litorea TaxID=2961595 RepID=UPI0020C2987B|nr:transcriptional regulator [Halomarina sp. BCD28]
MMNEPAESRREELPTAGRARDVMGELSRETDQEILEILVADSPLYVMEIAKIADRHPITVDQICGRLHEHGQIRPVGRGLYDVTEEGKRRLREGSDS